jgi:hypothetical protein
MTTQELIEYPFLDKIFLEYIKPNYGTEFKEAFKAIAAVISTDIDSASVNPDCDCTVKIASYIVLYRLECISFLVKYLNNLQNGNQILEELKTKVEHVNTIAIPYGGRVAKTSISEWRNFYSQIEKENGYFKQFSVVKDGDDILVFFL